MAGSEHSVRVVQFLSLYMSLVWNDNNWTTGPICNILQKNFSVEHLIEISFFVSVSAFYEIFFFLDKFSLLDNFLV